MGGRGHTQPTGWTTWPLTSLSTCLAAAPAPLRSAPAACEARAAEALPISEALPSVSEALSSETPRASTLPSARREASRALVGLGFGFGFGFG